MSTLYIIATPIGNLEDFSFRALRILQEVDLILCEDTRVTKKLLDHYNIKTQTLSYHQHSRLKKVNYILDLLKSGKDLALVSDAGTPGISDPGNQLVAEAIKQCSKTIIVSVPGPSALVTAVSISGFPMDKFLFLGYPPAKKKRKKFFEMVARSEVPVIFYESPHRILRSLCDLRETDAKLDAKQTRNLRVIVCKELTKVFEKVYRGGIEEVLGDIEKDGPRGEYTVVVSNK